MVQQLIDGIAHEVNFWRTFVTTERFIKGWLSTTPNPELHPEAAQMITARLPCTVLDVGSGPVSILRGTVPDGLLYSADPLGKFYEGLIDYKEFGVRPPAAVRAEDLPEWWRGQKIGKFGIVHISNALDHCQSPNHAITAMLKIIQPGGVLIIQGFENEADAERWQGLHQWNITAATDGEEVIIKMETTIGTDIHRGRGALITKELKNKKTWYIIQLTLSS